MFQDWPLILLHNLKKTTTNQHKQLSGKKKKHIDSAELVFCTPKPTLTNRGSIYNLVKSLFTFPSKLPIVNSWIFATQLRTTVCKDSLPPKKTMEEELCWLVFLILFPSIHSLNMWRDFFFSLSCSAWNLYSHFHADTTAFLSNEIGVTACESNPDLNWTLKSPWDFLQ